MPNGDDATKGRKGTGYHIPTACLPWNNTIIFQVNSLPQWLATFPDCRPEQRGLSQSQVDHGPADGSYFCHSTGKVTTTKHLPPDNAEVSCLQVGFNTSVGHMLYTFALVDTG